MTKTIAILLARLIFGGAFLLAASMKFAGMDATAGYIASIGFPFPLFFAWLAAFLEVALALAFLTGAIFSEAAVLAAAYLFSLCWLFTGRRDGSVTRWSSASSSTILPSLPGFSSRRYTVRAGDWCWTGSFPGGR